MELEHSCFTSETTFSIIRYSTYRKSQITTTSINATCRLKEIFRKFPSILIGICSHRTLLETLAVRWRQNDVTSTAVHLNLIRRKGNYEPRPAATSNVEHRLAQIWKPGVWVERTRILSIFSRSVQNSRDQRLFFRFAQHKNDSLLVCPRKLPIQVIFFQKYNFPRPALRRIYKVSYAGFPRIFRMIIPIYEICDKWMFPKLTLLQCRPIFCLRNRRIS